MMQKLLVVEDEDRVGRNLVDMFADYRGDLEVEWAHDAGEALRKLREFQPNGLLLDIMMPYGSAKEELARKTDPAEVETGLRLLRQIRAQEKHDGPAPPWPAPLWVSILTARSDVSVVKEARRLLGDCGRLYQKPCSSHVLQHDLVVALGLQSRVPPVLLPANHEAPTPVARRSS